MTILAMSILIASHAITIINTIIDGTITVMDITIMVIDITIMVVDITTMVVDITMTISDISIIVMDDRPMDLHHVRRRSGTSEDARAAVMLFHCWAQAPCADAGQSFLRHPWNLERWKASPGHSFLPHVFELFEVFATGDTSV
jgi:hypothetical protein